ncbi:MAG: anti-sigma regulatory factor [Acidobacteria bacterium]|nr:MAG: anti-sigma regulatory factor [Acidobacteriota bacterium]
MSDDDQGAVQIEVESDIAAARRVVREVATSIGFGVTETARIVTAASELGRNVYKYASKGTMHWRTLRNGEISGVELRFEDHGPGIADLDEAFQEGHSTGGGLGMGLPGAKRLMDEMEIRTSNGEGTTVTVRKWRQH